MSAFREFRLFLLLVVAFIALWAVVGSEEEEVQTDPRPSSYNATYPGLKSWYLLLGELGIRTRRLTGEFPEAIRDAGVFVLATPSEGVEEDHLRTMLDWVRGGGHLLLLGDALTDPATGEFQGDIALTRKTTKAPTQSAVPPSRPTALSKYVGKVHAGRFRYTRIPPGATRLYGDEHGALLVTWKEGEGRVTALADLAPLTNQNIDKEGNARLGAWLASAQPVVFDEFHHGFTSEPGFWGRLGAPLRIALYQLLFASLLMAWTYSRRFGPPLIPPFTDRRSAGEYVVSLGQLMRRAKADDTALKVVGHAFRHELAAWLGAPYDLPDEELVRATLDRMEVSRERLERALAASGGVPPPGMTPIQACRLIASVREELHLNVRPTALARPSALPS